MKERRHSRRNSGVCREHEGEPKGKSRLFIKTRTSARPKEVELERKWLLLHSFRASEPLHLFL